MPTTKLRRFSLLAINAIAAMMAICLAIYTIHGIIVPNPQWDQCRKKFEKIESRLKVNEEVQQECMEKVDQLVKSKEFLKAALLLEDMRALDRILVGGRIDDLTSTKDTALRYMKKAGYGKEYADYLRLRALSVGSGDKNGNNERR
jgi:hypothetical protein